MFFYVLFVRPVFRRLTYHVPLRASERRFYRVKYSFVSIVRRAIGVLKVG